MQILCSCQYFPRHCRVDTDVSVREKVVAELLPHGSRRHALVHVVCFAGPPAEHVGQTGIHRVHASPSHKRMFEWNTAGNGVSCE